MCFSIGYVWDGSEAAGISFLVTNYRNSISSLFVMMLDVLVISTFSAPLGHPLERAVPCS